MGLTEADWNREFRYAVFDNYCDEYLLGAITLEQCIEYFKEDLEQASGTE